MRAGHQTELVALESPRRWDIAPCVTCTVVWLPLQEADLSISSDAGKVGNGMTTSSERGCPLAPCSLAALDFSALAPFLKSRRVSFLKQENGKQISPTHFPRARRSAAGRADIHAARCCTNTGRRLRRPQLSPAATVSGEGHGECSWSVHPRTPISHGVMQTNPSFVKMSVWVHVSEPEAINPASYLRLAAVPHEARRPHFTFSRPSPFPISFREPARPFRKFSAHPAQAAVTHAASPSHIPAEQSDAVHLFILFFNYFFFGLPAFPARPRLHRERRPLGGAAAPRVALPASRPAPCGSSGFWGLLGFFFKPGGFSEVRVPMCLPHKQRLHSRRRGRSVRRGG